MAIDIRPRQETQIEHLDVSIDPAIAAEIDRFEFQIGEYLSGRLDEEVFRPIRLTNGIYGIRQGNNQQMVRVKIPHGRLNATKLRMLARIAEEYSRGFGHITTRQNVQFHFVPLRETPDVMRLLASVGMTTREACGDTVRNIAGCPVAGVCPNETFDVTPWAQATTDHLLRHPISQRLPRKFKINFSGCDSDCGQGMINDIGMIATRGPNGEAGFKILVGGGLGTTPFPAKVLEPFTPGEDLLITVESILRVFDRKGNRDNHLRARMKWLVDQMGIDDFRAAVFKERDKMRSVVGERAPHGVPQVVIDWGPDAQPHNDTGGVFETPHPERLEGEGFEAWKVSNTMAQRQPGKYVAYASLLLGDLTADQFRVVANLAEKFSGDDVRLTQRQNVCFRNISESDLPEVYETLAANGMARPGAERIRDVVSCPGADTCNLAVTQSRGLAKAIGEELEKAGLGDLAGMNINISGCNNSCGHHHIADIGFMGIERRINGNSAPGYQMFLGGGIVREEEVEFGARSLRVAAKRTPELVVALVQRYLDGREPGEEFKDWVRRVGVKEVGAAVDDLAKVRPFAEAPEDYIDWDEVEQFQVQLGRGECAP